jgi:hypothetical protein
MDDFAPKTAKGIEHRCLTAGGKLGKDWALFRVVTFGIAKTGDGGCVANPACIGSIGEDEERCDKGGVFRGDILILVQSTIWKSMVQQVNRTHRVSLPH